MKKSQSKQNSTTWENTWKKHQSLQNKNTIQNISARFQISPWNSEGEIFPSPSASKSNCPDAAARLLRLLFFRRASPATMITAAMTSLYQLTQGLNLPLMANGIGKLLELCRLLGVSFMSWFQNPPPPKKQTHTNIRSKTTLPFSHAKSRESSKQTWKGHEKTSNTFTFRSSPLLSNIFSRLDLPSCRCPALPRHCHHRWLNPTWSTKGVSAVFASRILYRTCNCVLSLRFFRKKSHTIIIHMLVSLRWH